VGLRGLREGEEGGLRLGRSRWGEGSSEDGDVEDRGKKEVESRRERGTE
jgi:hypothetical protein